MTKAEAGRLGGQATVRKYGRQYMSEIGRRGALELYRRYDMIPYGLTQFALVDKKTGIIAAIKSS